MFKVKLVVWGSTIFKLKENKAPRYLSFLNVIYGYLVRSITKVSVDSENGGRIDVNSY